MIGARNLLRNARDPSGPGDGSVVDPLFTLASGVIVEVGGVLSDAMSAG